jgi:hypothetical protein
LCKQDIRYNPAVRDFFTYGKSNQPKSPAREIHAHHLQMVNRNSRIEGRQRHKAIGRICWTFPGSV